jgi:hypothetical protein
MKKCKLSAETPWDDLRSQLKAHDFSNFVATVGDKECANQDIVENSEILIQDLEETGDLMAPTTDAETKPPITTSDPYTDERLP